MLDGATGGVELLLTGRAEDLRTGLTQAEFVYTRSLGYDGTDAIQVLLYALCFFLVSPGVAFSRPLGANQLPQGKAVPDDVVPPIRSMCCCLFCTCCRAHDRSPILNYEVDPIL